MSESMREAVEGFERDQEEKRRREVIPGTELINAQARLDARALVEHKVKELDAMLAVHRFRRQDVHDCITAANEQRQLAIAAPKLAEEANALATRLSDLAERIAELLEED